MMVLQYFGMVVQCLCTSVCEKRQCWAAELRDEGHLSALLVFAFSFREVTSRQPGPESSVVTACHGGADQGVKKEALLFGQKQS